MGSSINHGPMGDSFARRWGAGGPRTVECVWSLDLAALLRLPHLNIVFFFTGALYHAYVSILLSSISAHPDVIASRQTQFLPQWLCNRLLEGTYMVTQQQGWSADPAFSAAIFKCTCIPDLHCPWWAA